MERWKILGFMAWEERRELRCEETVREIIASFAFLSTETKSLGFGVFDFASLSLSSFLRICKKRRKERNGKQGTNTPTREEK